MSSWEKYCVGLIFFIYYDMVGLMKIAHLVIISWIENFRNQIKKVDVKFRVTFLGIIIKLRNVNSACYECGESCYSCESVVNFFAIICFHVENMEIAIFVYDFFI
jgi:hypothetical protein